MSATLRAKGMGDVASCCLLDVSECNQYQCQSWDSVSSSSMTVFLARKQFVLEVQWRRHIMVIMISTVTTIN
jgi:hypothetical protein